MSTSPPAPCDCACWAAATAATLQHAVERAVIDAAPEIQLVDVDEPETTPAGPDGSVPITLGRKPTYDACPSELAAT